MKKCLLWLLLFHANTVWADSGSANTAVLDVSSQSYAIEIILNTIKKQHQKKLENPMPLPGGWVKISPHSKSLPSRNKQRFQLMLSTQQRGAIETGELRSYRKGTRNWFTTYGLIKHHRVDAVAISSGFYVDLQKVDKHQVHIRLQPWLRRTHGTLSMPSKDGIAIEIGSGIKPGKIPSPEMYVSPKALDNPIVEFTAATTELTLTLGETVTIAATDHQALQLGTALLSQYSMSKSKNLTLTITAR